MTHLYFISTERQKVVKIGIANNPNKRLKTFQTAHYEKLIILKVIKINNRTLAFQLESALHKKFKKYHIRGEWFRLTPTLKKFIKNFQENHVSFLEQSIIHLSHILLILSILSIILFTYSDYSINDLITILSKP